MLFWWNVSYKMRFNGCARKPIQPPREAESRGWNVNYYRRRLRRNGFIQEAQVKGFALSWGSGAVLRLQALNLKIELCFAKTFATLTRSHVIAPP